MDAATLSKLKVADLKKELKNRGLAVTGNKNELVERLLAAAGQAPLSTVDGDDEDFDEEEILGGEIMDTSITPQEEEAALSGAALKVKKGAAAAQRTPQKGAAGKTPAKRSAPAATAVSPSKKAAVSVAASKENKEPVKADELNGSDDDDKLSLLEKRAERFGVPMTEEARKLARAQRFGVTSNGSLKAAKKLSALPVSVSVDKLKERAERFGEVTSKSLTKVEVDEKKKAREERFGAEEKAKKESIEAAKVARAARFEAAAK